MSGDVTGGVMIVPPDPTLRSVLARAINATIHPGEPVPCKGSRENADELMADPALAAAERVLAAADEWDRTDSIRDRRRLSEAVRDFRAYRSAGEAR